MKHPFWTESEIKAMAERATDAARKRKDFDEVIEILKPCYARTMFWVKTRYARFDRVSLDTLREWVEKWQD